MENFCLQSYTYCLLCILFLLMWTQFGSGSTTLLKQTQNPILKKKIEMNFFLSGRLFLFGSRYVWRLMQYVDPHGRPNQWPHRRPNQWPYLCRSLSILPSAISSLSLYLISFCSYFCKKKHTQEH